MRKCKTGRALLPCRDSSLTASAALHTFCTKRERFPRISPRFLRGGAYEGSGRDSRNCGHRRYALGRVRNNCLAAQGEGQVPLGPSFLPLHLAARIETGLRNHFPDTERDPTRFLWTDIGSSASDPLGNRARLWFWAPAICDGLSPAFSGRNAPCRDRSLF